MLGYMLVDDCWLDGFGVDFIYYYIYYEGYFRSL